MKITLSITSLLLTATLAHAQYHKYDTWDEPYTVSGLLGAVQYENLKFTQDDAAPGEDSEVDVSLLPQLGGAWTTLPRGEAFQYGLEATFLLGFRFDKINYAYLGGGGAVISLSTSMWMFDLAGGAYASLFLDPGQRFRLYVGGGPLMMYANYRTEADYSDATPTENESESVFGLGVYARGGFEFRVREKGMLGLGVRGNWAKADFSEVGGSSEVDGVAVFASYTAGF